MRRNRQRGGSGQRTNLKRRGLQPKTVDAHARAIRRMGQYFSHRIDKLSGEQRTDYFSELITTHSCIRTASKRGTTLPGLLALRRRAKEPMVPVVPMDTALGTERPKRVHRKDSAPDLRRHSVCTRHCCKGTPGLWRRATHWPLKTHRRAAQDTGIAHSIRCGAGRTRITRYRNGVTRNIFAGTAPAVLEPGTSSNRIGSRLRAIYPQSFCIIWEQSC